MLCLEVLKRPLKKLCVLDRFQGTRKMGKSLTKNNEFILRIQVPQLIGCVEEGWFGDSFEFGERERELERMFLACKKK